MTSFEGKKQTLKEWRNYLQKNCSGFCNKVNILINFLAHHISISLLHYQLGKGYTVCYRQCL